MFKGLLGTIALLSTIFLSPFSARAQDLNPYENLCAPVSDEFEETAPISAHNQQIDLLENGINPGFTSIAEIDNAQLMESVAQFQIVNNLPVTGRLDERTMTKLNIANPKLDSASAAIERAKPSR